MLYYVAGDFMSRTDIAPGYMTLHPGGIPHGPHPGTYEGSIGKTLDGRARRHDRHLRPLQVTAEAAKARRRQVLQKLDAA